MKLWRRLTLLVPLGLVLAGCGEWELTQNADLNVDLTPEVFRYDGSVNEETGEFVGGTSFPVAVTLTARPGSLAVEPEGYSLEFFFADGNPVLPGNNMFMVTDGAFPPVPAGVVCEESESDTCSINSPGASLDFGEPVELIIEEPLPQRIMNELYCDARPDAYARMMIFGEDSRRRSFTIEISSIPIVASSLTNPDNCIVVNPEEDNSPPTPTSEFINIAAGQQVTPIPVSAIAEDSDEGDVLTVLAVVSQASRGRAAIVNRSAISYTPSDSFFAAGVDSFTVTVSDGTATVDIDVTVVAQANRAPVALGNPVTVVAGQLTPIPVGQVAGDPDGDSLFVLSIANQAANGRANVSSGGIITYEPNANFTAGGDTFTVVVSDGIDVVSIAVLVTVSAPTQQQSIQRNTREVVQP